MDFYVFVKFDESDKFRGKFHVANMEDLANQIYDSNAFSTLVSICKRDYPRRGTHEFLEKTLENNNFAYYGVYWSKLNECPGF